MEWDMIPDELLLYIYLHTNTTLRQQRSERTNGYKASTLPRHSTLIKQPPFLHHKGMMGIDLTTKLAPVAQLTEALVDRDLHEHEVAQLLALLPRAKFVFISFADRVVEFCLTGFTFLPNSLMNAIILQKAPGYVTPQGLLVTMFYCYMRFCKSK